MDATTTSARCPKCHRRTSTASSANQHAFYCHHCKMEFEDLDDGDIGYGRPSRRIERHERRKCRYCQGRGWLRRVDGQKVPCIHCEREAARR